MKTSVHSPHSGQEPTAQHDGEGARMSNDGLQRLWVDDLRPPPDSRPSPYNPGETISDRWWWAKNSKAAIDWLSSRKQHRTPVAEISLDHDLGGDDTTRPIVLWMCEREFWPDVVRVHTANPVGREWLEGMVKRYKPEQP